MQSPKYICGACVCASLGLFLSKLVFCARRSKCSSGNSGVISTRWRGGIQINDLLRLSSREIEQIKQIQTPTRIKSNWYHWDNWGRNELNDTENSNHKFIFTGAGSIPSTGFLCGVNDHVVPKNLVVFTILFHIPLKEFLYQVLAIRRIKSSCSELRFFSAVWNFLTGDRQSVRAGEGRSLPTAAPQTYLISPHFLYNVLYTLL